jgi:5S rRNA maturation endonuclease (ribonuclease M5)
MDIIITLSSEFRENKSIRVFQYPIFSSHKSLIPRQRFDYLNSISMRNSSHSEAVLIESLSTFMKKLNDEDDALVVVEGLRDAKALRDSGFVGNLFMLCQNSSVSKLEDTAVKFKKTILLLDNDSEGRRLVRRTQDILRGRVSIDLYYQRKLLPASKGKIRHIEEFSSYSDKLSRHV